MRGYYSNIDQENKMQNYQLRVVIESSELEIKYNDLKSFIDSDSVFDGLKEYDKDSLQQQLEAMKEYLNILEGRINGF